MKRFISILLSIILCLSISPYAMAASNTAASSNDKLLAINANNSSQYALSFVKSIFPGTNWSAGEILVIYNENDAVGGFCVDILDGAQDNGYVIVKFANNEPVISPCSSRFLRYEIQPWSASFLNAEKLRWSLVT